VSTARRHPAIAAAFAIALACRGALPTAGAAEVVAGAGTALALKSCRLEGLDHDAMCGALKRPLDPALPHGRSIDVHVAVLPALARQKHPDPVFFFAGGPGQSAIDLAGSIQRMLGRLGSRRDIVLVDQRGTGRSAPLACDSPGPEESLAQAFDRSRLVAAIGRCRETLEKLPYGDLRQFTTPIAMADVDAVRAALGADRIDLVGVSYGTRAALEYMRAYPTHVRRVVLDAVAPPDMVLPATMGTDAATALDALFRDCAAAPACEKAHPELAARWRALLATLPRTVTADDPTDGRPRTFTLTRDVAWGLVRPGLYVPAFGAALPYAIEAASAGRFGPLLTLGSAMGGVGGLELFEGMHFSVVCAEDVPRLAPESASSPDDGNVSLYREVCARWPHGAVPAAFYTVTPSAAPLLLLSGAVDPVTPPRHAERVAAALGPKARHVVVPHAGHGALGLSCVRDASVRFIETVADDDALKVDLTCVAALPRPLPFTPPLPRRAASAASASSDLPAVAFPAAVPLSRKAVP
jgi:pimeloyl-ACP methyl ester carboxylesterase